MHYNGISVPIVMILFSINTPKSWTTAKEIFDITKKPLIIWWYSTIFPHYEIFGKNRYAIRCHGGAECDSTRDRRLSAGDELQTMLIYGSDFAAYDAPLPRKPNHLWALLHEESPQNNYILCQPQTIQLFNLSATFKEHSDYPLTTQHLDSFEYLVMRKPVSIQNKNKYRHNGLAAVAYLQSHCDVPSDRDRYVKELMKYIQIDSYGGCLHNKDFDSEHLNGMNAMEHEELYDILAKYKFHIAFENAICVDYITEKLYRAFHVGSVPIYRGASNVKEWAPSNHSLVLVDEFDSPKSLAKFVKYLDENDDAYLPYLQYKNEEKAFNKNLQLKLEERTWLTLSTASDFTFVHGFECYVCEQMHKVLEFARSKGRLPKPKTLPADHLECPRPKPSFGLVEDLSEDDGFHKWAEDFSQSIFQSGALHDLLVNNESDPSLLWNYVEKRMEDEYKHMEL